MDEQQLRPDTLAVRAGLDRGHHDETAEALGVSPTTVKDDWRLARAWLYREVRA